MFPARRPWEFLTKDILGLLPEAKVGKRVFFLIKNWYWKKTRPVSTRNTTATDAKTIFWKLGHALWLPTTVYWHITAQNFLENFFCSVRRIEHKINIHNLLLSQNKRAVNMLTERFNGTVINPLCHYIRKHQKDWDPYLHPLVYA